MNRQYNKRQIIHNAFLRCVYILILCLGSMGIYGQQQTYPVQVYTQLTPPYTPHIPAYYTGTQNKLKVMLINTDMQQPLVKVYLRMKILSSSFSAITPPEVYTPQIELQAGMPMTLSLNDLEPYFKKENLRVSGGQGEFYRTQMLPDNFYRFHFEVYEEGTNRLVSNPKIGFAQAMIAAGEPPILNLPLKGSVIKESNIPSIMFSWTPRHMNSVAAAYGTEYDISLVEIYDKQVAPEAAFDYSRVLYTETTKSTSFIHTVAQPLLIPGLRYAWRVQAKAREGVDEISVFKNNGYSLISWFDYTADCKTVQNCGAIYENGHVDISWQDLGAMEYTVEYRKKGTSRWYTGVINKPLLSQLYNLQAGKDYEYRIGSRCVTGDAFQYNNPQAFHIPDRQENGPNCGLMPDINLTNQTPTRELQSGMPVLAGDFPVFITSVSGSGRFTGEGYVGIPYLEGAKIAVSFKDIVVNTDNRLVSGYFETKYDTKNNNLLFDADQYQTGGKGVGDIRSGEEQAAFKVDYTINPDIKALSVKADGTKDEITGGKDYTIAKGENGKYTFILTDSEGKEHKVEADAMPTTIEDKEGNTYEVNEKGEVKPVSKNSDIKLDSSTKDTQSKLAALSFKATANTKYALDEYRDVYEKVTEYKDQYKPEGTAITASAKFMLPGASDEISVYINENKENKLIPEKVHFITGKGKEYSAVYDNQTKGWTLTIVGGQANDGQELYAVQEVGKDKYETLGKLNIFTYEPLERKVTLVPVNGKNNNLDGQAVQDGLNEVYGKIGIHWTVNVLEKPFSYTPKNGSTFNVTGSGLLSMFTDDMKAINEAFKTSGEYQEDGLYLFVLPYDVSDKGEISGTNGDMPLGSQFGYLFPGASIRTIAHEVGHGAFNLEHPFDRPGRNSFPEKGMLEYNLMEYPTKDAEKWTELVKLQWDATRAPGHVIGLFQTDKSGMFAGGYVFTPDYKITHINSSTTIIIDPSNKESLKTGALPGFEITENGVVNRYIWKNGAYVLYDYDKQEYIDSKTYKLSEQNYLRDKQSTIYLFYNLENPCGGQAYIQTIYAGDIASLVDNINKNNIQDKTRAFIEIINALKGKSSLLPCQGTKDDINESAWKVSNIPVNCGAADIRLSLAVQLENIGKITNGTSPENVFNILKENYSPCLISLLDIEKRILIINKIIDNDKYWKINETNILSELILTTSQQDRVKLLRDGVQAGNYHWLKQVYETANFDITKHVYQNINCWVLENYRDLDITLTQEKRKTIRYSEGQEEEVEYSYPAGAKATFLGVNEKEYEYNRYNIKLCTNTHVSGSGKWEKDKVQVNVCYTWSYIENVVSSGSIIPIYTEQYSRLMNPFEPMDLTVIGNYAEIGYNNGDSFTTTAFMGMLLVNEFSETNKDRALRGFFNDLAIAGAIIAAPATGGSSLTAIAADISVVAGSVALTDNMLQGIKTTSSVEEYVANKEFYDAWNNFHTGVMLADGAAGVAVLGKSVVAGVTKIGSWDNFIVIAKRNAHLLKGEFAEAWKAIRGLKSTINNVTFDLNKLKGLLAQTPTGKYLTNISKNMFDQHGLSIAKSSEGNISVIIDDIMKNGDLRGEKTEAIIDILMDTKGYQKIDAKYNGVNGFDGCYIPKGQTLESATEVFISESKQFKQGKLAEFDEIAKTNYDNTSGLVLNSPSSTGLPTQMSDDWVEYVINKMRYSSNIETQTIGNTLNNMYKTNPQIFTKYVNAIDKSTGEVWFMKLDNF